MAAIYTPADLSAARQLGAAAYAKGINAPCLDRAVMAMIPKGAEVGTSIPLFSAWQEGFTAALILAPWWTCEKCGVLGYDDGACCAVKG